MICVNKFLVLGTFLAALALESKSTLASPVEDCAKWEAVWEKELSPFYGLSLAAGLELAKTRLSLKVITEDKAQPPADEKETQAFYSAYFRLQRFRPYTAMLILPEQKLPGDFKKRPLEKETLLIVNASTTKESFLHLALHLATDKKESQSLAQEIQELRKEKLSANTTLEIRERQLKILNLDSEAEKDLFIHSKSKDFEIPENEKPILLTRIEKNINRLETSFKALENLKDTKPDLVEYAAKKIESLKEKLKKAKA